MIRQMLTFRYCLSRLLRWCPRRAWFIDWLLAAHYLVLIH
jgi:hypothetical protein